MRVRLAQLDHARREFIANASHELRTPLFSLGGFLELLDDEELDEPTRREFLDAMREQVDRLTKLATDLLDLSRLDAGRLTRRARAGRPRARSPSELVEEFGRGARGRRPRARARDGRRRRVALGDERACCRSAGSWSRTRSCTRRAGTHGRGARAVRDGRAVLEVADDGPGIPAEQQEQVFERFYRLDGSARLRQRARAGDRARAGGADGRDGSSSSRGPADGLHARAAAAGAVEPHARARRRVRVFT